MHSLHCSLKHIQWLITKLYMYEANRRSAGQNLCTQVDLHVSNVIDYGHGICSPSVNVFQRACPRAHATSDYSILVAG